ncbi:hypothetical protein [Herpetosiphon gulosus]|uniref:Helix-turn-helix domain-containing protein n=1 Tax=Herpetosiphon gulosus TaxID=1973496 RepID=A0ABP9X620_9CHLR
MTDDHAQSSPNEYITLSEAAAMSGVSYYALYKAIRRERLKATMFEPDHVPAEVWNRLAAHAQANVAKQEGIWVTTKADLEIYLQSRRPGHRSDLL